jgi:Spy/CpxP family protein refolding chaperone
MFRVAVVLVLAALWAIPAGAQTQQRGRTPAVRPADRSGASRDASQRDRHKWWLGPDAKEIVLTNDQSQRMEAIYQQALPRIQSSMQDADAGQKELDKIIAGDRTTEDDVVRQLNKVQTARNEVNRQYVLMMFRMNRELTAEQRAKAQAIRDRLRDRREQERREGRRGEPPQRPPTKK